MEEGVGLFYLDSLWMSEIKKSPLWDWVKETFIPFTFTTDENGEDKFNKDPTPNIKSVISRFI